MRAAVYRGPGEIEVEDVPKPAVESPTDAVVRVTHTAICGSDLWFYRGQSDREDGSRVGHEPMGVVESVGDDVRSVEPGDRVFAPFVVSCGKCEFCRKGLHTSCVDGDSWSGDDGGAQGEYVRASHADGTLVRVPDRYADDEDALRSLLPLTDVMGTGHHAAVSAAAAMDTAIDVCRPGGTVGYVGVPHGVDDEGLDVFTLFSNNITLNGGVAPVRAYAEALMDDVLGGTVDPAPVFTETVGLDEIAAGYRAMDDREAVKVLVEP